MELPVKEKLNSIPPNAKFSKWATAELKMKDMTAKIQTHTLETTKIAPKIPRIYGTINCRLTSSIPVFCEIIHEGFVHLWREESTNWQLVWACLKNGSLKFSADPRAKSESIFEMVILGSLRATEASRRRANSIQLRDNERKIIMAAPHKDDMKDWIHLIRKHKNHLRRWGRLIGSLAQEDDEPTGSSEVSSNPPWSALFLGGAKVIQSSYKKRRSRSVDMSPRPLTASGPTRTRVRRRSGSQETPDRKNIKTNRMGCSMPIARFQTPSLAPLDLSLNDSMTMSELELGPGSPMPKLHLDPTMIDSDDNSFVDEGPVTTDLGAEISDSFTAAKRSSIPDDGTICLVPVGQKLQPRGKAKNLPTQNQPPTRREPMRTSTQIGDENHVRKKYQAEPSLSPIKSDSGKVPLMNLLSEKQNVFCPGNVPQPKTKKSPISKTAAARLFPHLTKKDNRISFDNAVRRNLHMDSFEH